MVDMEASNDASSLSNTGFTYQLNQPMLDSAPAKKANLISVKNLVHIKEHKYENKSQY